MSETAGKHNGYRCMTCGHLTVTVNRVDGVTPMFIMCQAGTACTGRMGSLMYRLPLGAPSPSHEWYRPWGGELKRLRRHHPAMFDHVGRGGLLIRKIGSGSIGQ